MIWCTSSVLRRAVQAYYELFVPSPCGTGDRIGFIGVAAAATAGRFWGFGCRTVVVAKLIMRYWAWFLKLQTYGGQRV